MLLFLGNLILNYMRFTKFIGVVVILSFITANLKAQRFNASIIAGINLSQLDGDDLNGYNRIGLNAGGKVAAVLSDRLELNLELLYSQKGSSRSKTDGYRSSFDDIRLNFVKVPIYLSFSDWKFKVNAGFSYARLINYTVNDVFDGDVTDLFDYHPNIFSYVIGATYYFRENIGLDIHWTKSISDIQGDSGANQLIDRTIGIRLLYVL